MVNPILFCNIGWMERYEGVTDFDKVIGGGKYVKVHNDGGEVYCFLNRGNRCYGYVQPVNQSKSVSGGVIKIEKLGAKKNAEFIEGIDVVLTATKPVMGGTFVVGVYKNAVVYRNKQEFDSKLNVSHLDTQSQQYGYRFMAESANVILLKPDQRTIRVPRAAGKLPAKGGMGQSNVWYAKELKDEVFFESIRRLIDGKIDATVKHDRSKTDVERNKRVETTAIDLTTKYYVDFEYVVSSVEKDNLGWDLVATNGSVILNIEVKGLSGDNIYVGLTPNECRAFSDHEMRVQYRLAIVTECLTNPKLEVFSFNQPSEKWVSQNGKILSVQYVTSASIALER